MAWYKELFTAEDPLRFGIYGESEKSRAQVDFVVENGSRSERTNTVRFFAFTEIAKMLAQAGLKVRSVFGDWEGSEFIRTSKGMLILSEKEA